MKKQARVCTLICMLCLALTSNNLFAKELASGQHMEQVTSFLNLMDQYLKFAERWVKVISEEETTVLIVIERIQEIYEERGDLMQAVPEFKKILDKYRDNSAIKKLIHFKLAELYKETGQASKALEELNKIIDLSR